MKPTQTTSSRERLAFAALRYLAAAPLLITSDLFRELGLIVAGHEDRLSLRWLVGAA